MAQPQANISLTAPGFYGLNTQDSPLDMEINFASEANNCVIDDYGRIASRRGFQYLTTNPEILNGQPIETIFEFTRQDTGASFIFAAGNLQIFLQDPTQSDLVALTLPNVPTGNKWQMAVLNNKCFFVQAGHAPLVFDPLVSTVALQEWAETPKGTDYPNTVHAAFGRLWTSAYDSDSALVSFSGLLNGENWSSSGTGAFDTGLYWPSGYDAITGIAAHNNFMIVYGMTNILVYSTTSDVVSTLNLVDTIEGIGCIARDSIIGTGTDFMFIDATGVRSLNRTIQEKSLPISDISRNVRSQFQFALKLEPQDDIRAVYHVEDNFYACFLPSNPLTYVFDTWSPLPDASARASVWTNVKPRCGVRLDSRETLFAGLGGVYVYSGGEDIFLDPADDVTEVVQSIPMSYVTHPIDFGSPANLVFPKQVDVTFYGALTGNLTLKWGYDYADALEPRTIVKDLSGAGGFTFWYGEAQAVDTQGLGQWTSDDPQSVDYDPAIAGFYTTGTTLQQFRYNVWGQGRNVRFGLFSDTLGAPVSIQELNVQALQGRML